MTVEMLQNECKERELPMEGKKKGCDRIVCIYDTSNVLMFIL
jgi:hypothetical protein